MKYIQSFYQYPVTFSSIGKTLPAKNAEGESRNIAEFTEAEITKLENCEPFYRELLRNKKIRVINHIPTSYIPASERINKANETAEILKNENAELEKKNAELEKKIAELEKLAKSEKDSESAELEEIEEVEESTETPKKRGRKAKTE